MSRRAPSDPRPSGGILRVLVRGELAGALRARWFLAYAALFLVAGGVLAFLGGGQVLVEGHRGSLRAMAGLMHLVILFVPVMALIPAVSALSDDRESGMLEYLLAQPVGPGQVFGGKWLGTALAMILAVLLGMAPGAAGAVLRGVSGGLVLLILGLTLLLGLAFVSLGMGLSALTRIRARATALGLGAWLVFLMLGTLGMMASFVRWGVPEGVLLGWSVVNPVEAFRLAVLTAMDPEAGLLGPVGAALLESAGSGGVVALAGVSLAAWTILPGALGLWLFRRGPGRDGR